jgi:hypothetical protein
MISRAELEALLPLACAGANEQEEMFVSAFLRDQIPCTKHWANQ